MTLSVALYGRIRLPDEPLSIVGNFLNARDYLNYITSCKAIYEACIRQDMRRSLYLLPKLSPIIRSFFVNGIIIPQSQYLLARQYHEVERFLPLDSHLSQSELARQSPDEFTARAIYETFCAQRCFLEPLAHLSAYDLLLAKSKIESAISTHFISWKSADGSNRWQDRTRVTSFLWGAMKVNCLEIFQTLLEADTLSEFSSDELSKFYTYACQRDAVNFLNFMLSNPRFIAFTDELFLEGLYIVIKRRSPAAFEAIINGQRFDQLDIRFKQTVIAATILPSSEPTIEAQNYNSLLKIALRLPEKFPIPYEVLCKLIDLAVRSFNFEALSLILSPAHVTKRVYITLIANTIKQFNQEFFSHLINFSTQFDLQASHILLLLKFCIKFVNVHFFKIILENDTLTKFNLANLEEIESYLNKAFFAGALHPEIYKDFDELLMKKLLMAKYVTHSPKFTVRLAEA